MSRLINFFKRLPMLGRWFHKGGKDASFENYSKFKRFFETMDSDDPFYPSVRQTSALCDDALRIAKQRIKLGTRMQDCDEKLLELEYIGNLSDEDLKKFRKLLDYFISITAERSMLYNRLSDYDKSLTRLFELENDANMAIQQIRDAEERQRLLKHDLGYLYGEKADLVYERENMEKGLQFIHYFTIGLLGVFVVTTLFLGFVYIFGGTDIFVPTTIIILMVIVIASLLYIFRRRIKFELRVNFKKQLLAVELLNKKNVVYAYYTNFLKFTYNKYKVRNAQMLENNLNDFGDYKILVGHIDSLRKVIHETENEIERFMREKKLTGIHSTIENFARTVDLEDKKRYYNELLIGKKSIEAELAALDVRHEEVWDALMMLNERDRSPNKIIDKIIQAYLDEAGALLAEADNSSETSRAAPA